MEYGERKLTLQTFWKTTWKSTTVETFWNNTYIKDLVYNGGTLSQLGFICYQMKPPVTEICYIIIHCWSTVAVFCTDYWQCFGLPSTTWWWDPIAKDTTYLYHKTCRNLTDTQLKALPLLPSDHCARSAIHTTSGESIHQSHTVMNPTNYTNGHL